MHSHFYKTCDQDGQKGDWAWPHIESIKLKKGDVVYFKMAMGAGRLALSSKHAIIKEIYQAPFIPTNVFSSGTHTILASQKASVVLVQ